MELINNFSDTIVDALNSGQAGIRKLSLGDRISLMRKLLNISTRELAIITGMSKEKVESIEKGLVTDRKAQFIYEFMVKKLELDNAPSYLDLLRPEVDKSEMDKSADSVMSDDIKKILSGQVIINLKKLEQFMTQEELGQILAVIKIMGKFK